MNVFESTGTEMLRKANAINADKERSADALVRISADIHLLRKELAAERKRAEKAEAANKRYSLYIAVISGIISSAVSIFLTYLFLH
jgi:hypothetical protein